jgi:MerR family redox-sensitive transcriptional activator SoxR
VAAAETTLDISEVSAASGLRPSALRYYEDVGLISPVGRRGGRRLYRASVLPRLALVALAQDVGFTISEIRTLLEGHGKENERWREMTRRQLGEIELRLEKLQAMKRLLQQAAACECSGVEGCELIESAAERRRSGERMRAALE